MDDKRLHATVRGRVQGVNFRWYTRQKAQELGLCGWIRNLADGRSVELVAEGNRALLGDLIRFLNQGPPMARVEDLDLKWGAATGEFKDFTVRFL